MRNEPQADWFRLPTDDRPFHVTPLGFHPSAFYPAFIGGNLLFTTEQYERMNGYTTRCFGHGKEDDNVLLRLVAHGMMPADVLPFSTVFGSEAFERMRPHLLGRAFLVQGLWRSINDRCDRGGSVRIHGLVERNMHVAEYDVISGLTTVEGNAVCVGAAMFRSGVLRLQFDLSPNFVREFGAEEAARYDQELRARGSSMIP